jgi:hypothetical protein
VLFLQALACGLGSIRPLRKGGCCKHLKSKTLSQMKKKQTLSAFSSQEKKLAGLPASFSLK